jgi:hypothetical protein
METFAPGDRVVAIDTCNGPLKALHPTDAHPFHLPDGTLRHDTVYHVRAVRLIRDGSQGVYLTGLRVFWGPDEIAWSATRFRKVDTLSNHIPKKRRRKQPVLTCAP